MRASLICCGPHVGQASNFCGQTQGAYAGILCGGVTIGTLSGLTRCAPPSATTTVLRYSYEVT